MSADTRSTTCPRTWYRVQAACASASHGAIAAPVLHVRDAGSAGLRRWSEVSWRCGSCTPPASSTTRGARVVQRGADLTPPTLLTQTTLERVSRSSPRRPCTATTTTGAPQVSAFDLHDEHTELVVTATSTVETTAADATSARTVVAWDALRPHRRQTGSPSTSRRPTRTAVDDELVAELPRTQA